MCEEYIEKRRAGRPFPRLASQFNQRRPICCGQNVIVRPLHKFHSVSLCAFGNGRLT